MRVGCSITIFGNDIHQLYEKYLEENPGPKTIYKRNKVYF